MHAVRYFTAVAIVVLAAACTRASKSADSTSTPADTTVAAPPMMPAAGDSAPMAKADSDMQAVLDQLAALHGKPIETLTAVEARKQPTPTDAVKALLVKMGKPTTPPPGVTTVDCEITGAAGTIKARIYTPDQGTKPLPIIVYYHGGGFVIATIDTYDGGARALSRMAKAIVISVEYRKAPESKFPAAHDDAFAAYKWAMANASKIGGDSSRMALAGESAGGNLAVATAMAVRDAKLPLPKYVLSVYPIAQPDTETASYKENAAAKPLSRPMMEWFLKQYERTPADGMDPRINLAGADLKGLPPVMIINAQIDPLRTDGEMLEKKLKADGVTVERKVYPGVTHEFFGMGAVVAKAKDAEQTGASALADALAK
ncbi:MAG: alpha/beta hydrolase [Gemmatimonadaceae bacterium]|nr:alpha/beta hydrolase [Gemmatimonadaceae bacterium]